MLPRSLILTAAVGFASREQVEALSGGVAGELSGLECHFSFQQLVHRSQLGRCRGTGLHCSDSDYAERVEMSKCATGRDPLSVADQDADVDQAVDGRVDRGLIVMAEVLKEGLAGMAACLSQQVDDDETFNGLARLLGCSVHRTGN